MARAVAKTDPAVEAALAASMARLAARTAEAAARKINGGSGGQSVDSAPSSNDATLQPPDGAKPSPTPAAIPEVLKWQKPIDEAKRSVCGRYAVCRVTVNGKRHYELWHLVPSGNWFNRIGGAFESFEAAANFASEHAEGKR